ncbi:hypothetical protein E5676_scaffold418G00470 [Cucumis melo var. makuwa]|uniref:Uncharacterized protein n=1 Tax=Cucumis melo var. makuwa TaxID=1194695 RepID=A0A5D3D612_CUCMM|nr:hypothetical protein E6C27_scaffold284G00350 [Cucumis melo var. makuwa]TYK18960.1 hypothetical protein E5676_scaffold418G00470 [Cucumis melo var. makuwa]
MESKSTCVPKAHTKLWRMDSIERYPPSCLDSNSFTKIGDACGGYVDVASEKKNKFDLIEIVIKIHYNYSRFIPTTTRLIDEEGNCFIIQTITNTESRWLKERSPRIHGTFTRKAAVSFNEFNNQAEQYNFIDDATVLPNQIG